MICLSLMFLRIMPHSANPLFFFSLKQWFCNKDAQWHKHLLLKRNGSLGEFIAIWKEYTPFPSSQVTSTYPQIKNNISLNSSLRYKWLDDSSIWIDREFLVSSSYSHRVCGAQIQLVWYMYNEVHIAKNFSVKLDLGWRSCQTFACANVNRNLYPV